MTYILLYFSTSDLREGRCYVPASNPPIDERIVAKLTYPLEISVTLYNAKERIVNIEL